MTQRPLPLRGGRVVSIAYLKAWRRICVYLPKLRKK